MDVIGLQKQCEMGCDLSTLVQTLRPRASQMCHRVHCLARNVFLLYVNDLESNVPLYKYVDDSTLFEICNTTDVSVMQESIDRAVNWTNNNCMKINSKKSKEMVICFTPDENVRNYIPSIVIDGNIVETVEYAKLLGVTLSNDFSWNRQLIVL